jgi:hypothetical protein
MFLSFNVQKLYAEKDGNWIAKLMAEKWHENPKGLKLRQFEELLIPGITHFLIK